MADLGGKRAELAAAIKDLLVDAWDAVSSMAAEEVRRFVELPNTSIEDLDTEIRRRSEKADFGDVLTTEQAQHLREGVEAGVFNTFAEAWADVSISELREKSLTARFVCYLPALLLAFVGVRTIWIAGYAHITSTAISTFGFLVLRNALSNVRFRFYGRRQVRFLASLFVLVFAPLLVSFPKWITTTSWDAPSLVVMNSKAREVVNWYDTATLTLWFTSLLVVWWLLAELPVRVLIGLQRRAGVSASDKDRASSRLFLGLVEVALLFKDELSGSSEGERSVGDLHGESLKGLKKELAVAGVRLDSRRYIAAYLLGLASHARTAWIRSLKSSYRGLRRDAGLIGNGVSEELLRVRREVALGSISADEGYRIFANAASAFIEGRWRDMMMIGYQRRDGLIRQAWKVARYVGGLLIAGTAVLVGAKHLVPMAHPFDGTLTALGVGYIVVRLLVLTDPDFKVNFDITGKVLEGLRAGRPK